MKHAYLIIAHSQFNILQNLLSLLDDERNDIFIHFDRKVKTIPHLHLKRSELIVLEDRVDIRWADFSMVKAEYALFQAAFQREDYAYFHLLSGVDLPLKTQDDIHAFFQANSGKEFIGYSQYDYKKEVDRKARRYHLFPKNFRPTDGIADIIRRGLRFALLEAQNLFGVMRNADVELKKGTQWVSVSRDFVALLMEQKQQVHKRFHHTFCSDEIYKQTLCWHSAFRHKIYQPNDEGQGCMRMIGWQNGMLKDWTDADYQKLTESGALFARKFSGDNPAIATRIVKRLIDRADG